MISLCTKYYQNIFPQFGLYPNLLGGFEKIPLNKKSKKISFSLCNIETVQKKHIQRHILLEGSSFNMYVRKNIGQFWSFLTCTFKIFKPLS